jgi:hypothetical protein
MLEFQPAELDYELPRESASVVNVERPRSESAQSRKAESLSDRELDAKESDTVGPAGKGNAEAETWKAPRKSDRETV